MRELVYMGAGGYRRGMAQLGYCQGGGGVRPLSINERNRLAHEYSRRCRKLRLLYTLWVVAIVLAMTLICLFVGVLNSLDKPEEKDTAAATVVLPVLYDTEEVKSGVFDICGYCACCTPYADINQDENGRVLTASGQWVEIGQCVAVDTDIIPLGSIVTIDGQAYTALDTGVNGYVIDILMSHEDAHSAGVRTELVTWRTAEHESS